MFTADLRLASEDTLQLLSAAGINTDYISLDKTNQPYFDFRNLIYEKRWVCHRHNMLLFELKHLEQDPTDGKINHPAKVMEMEFLNDGGIKEVVMEGAKDISDAVAGSVVTCMKHGGVPMDVKTMQNLLSKTATTTGNEPAEEINKLLGLRDDKGDLIEGTKHGEQINRVNEIFRRLHER